MQVPNLHHERMEPSNQRGENAGSKPAPRENSDYKSALGEAEIQGTWELGLGEKVFCYFGFGYYAVGGGFRSAMV